MRSLRLAPTPRGRLRAVLFLSITLAALPAWSQNACRISVDFCPIPGPPFIGATLDLSITSSSACRDKAAEVYDACGLDEIANIAPADTLPRRVKTEFLSGDQTVEVNHCVAVPTPDPPPTTGSWPCSLLAQGEVPDAAIQRGRPIVGAIRFDEWHSEANFAETQLFHHAENEDWQSRLPFYTTVDGNPVTVPYATGIDPSRLDVASDRQSVVDAEILYANKGGLAYWAFNWWGRYNWGATATLPASPLGAAAHWRNRVAHDRSLQLYLTSPYRNRIDFALLIPVNRFGPVAPFANAATSDEEFQHALFEDGTATSSWFEVYIEQWIELASEPGYQTVLGDRPLIYFFSAQQMGNYWSSDARAALAMRRLRQRFVESGLGNPYLVGMFWGPSFHGDTHYQADRFGLDAVTQYAIATQDVADACAGDGDPATPTIVCVDDEWGTSCAQNYANPCYQPPGYLLDPNGVAELAFAGLLEPVEADNKQVVPNVTTGWDPRPASIPDVSWSYHFEGCGGFPFFDCKSWSHPADLEPGTSLTAPQKIAQHLGDVTDWMGAEDLEPAGASIDSTEANTLLIYAWNEFSEGGYLAPTFADGTSRLDAIRQQICDQTGPNQPVRCRTVPTGHVGFAGGGQVTGWAYDPDLPSRAIEVAFYAGAPFSNDPATSGKWIGTMLADEFNAGDNVSLHITGKHRFTFRVPQEHHGKPIYVHAIDPVRGSQNPLLLHYGADHFVHPTECSNGVDDDEDGFVDKLGGDPQCRYGSDRSERADCSDGFDDDGDGKIDWAGLDLNGDADFDDRELPPDPQCGKWGQGHEGTGTGNCYNLVDDDGDGFADVFGVDLDGHDGFDGVEAPADPDCGGNPQKAAEQKAGCGLGAELLLMMLLWRRRRGVRELPPGA